MAFTDSPETKLVQNMAFEDYCKARGVNQSRLRKFDYELEGCPELYRYLTLHPDADPDTVARAAGRRYHTFILEPEAFDKVYAVRTKQLETELFAEAKLDKACRAKGFSANLGTYQRWKAKQEAAGLEVITQGELDVLHDMRRALLLNKDVWEEIGKCTPDMLELSAFCGYEFRRGPHQGKKLQLKARLDLVPVGDAIIDLKTARSANRRRFANQVAELGMSIQASVYLDCANANGLKKKRFGFMAQEKTPPYLSCIHWMPDDWIAHGRRRYTVILSNLADAIAQDRWPGYESGVLMPPAWLMPEIEAAA